MVFANPPAKHASTIIQALMGKSPSMEEKKEAERHKRDPEGSGFFNRRNRVNTHTKLFLFNATFDV